VLLRRFIPHQHRALVPANGSRRAALIRRWHGVWTSGDRPGLRETERIAISLQRLVTSPALLPTRHDVCGRDAVT
jgi:hypothetical protein